MLGRTAFSGVLILVLTFAFSACQRQNPTVVPKVEANKKSAEMGTPIEVTYAFSTKKNYVALFKDMTVFVHFIDPKGVRRFQDDHVPPKPTSDWRPEGNYNYTRTVFIPKNIPAGEYEVVVGIYSPTKGERIPLEAKEYGNRSYEMGKLLIEIPPQEPVIQYTSGWYDPESDAKDVGTTWRWTTGNAVMSVRNPQAEALLYVKVDGVPERFPEPQTITILVGDNKVDSFQISNNTPVMKKYNIPGDMLGNDKIVEVKLQVDKTFVPAQDNASRDTRELGIRVYELYLGKASD